MTAAMLVLASIASPPHLIQLVIDDLGMADTSVPNSPAQAPDIPTPHLRDLANGGVRLSHYYVQPVCSPTRFSLLTGRFPFRDGMQHEGTIAPGSTAHIPLTTPTAAELLGAAGYDCHMIGKWHQGYASWKYTPLQRGFKSFTGYLQGQVDYFNKTMSVPPAHPRVKGFDFWHGESTGRLTGKRSTEFRAAVGSYSLDQYRAALKQVLTPYATRQLAAAASLVVEEEEPPAAATLAAGVAPLYLYLAMQTVHIPLEARLAGGEKRCASIGDQWRAVYCAMLVEMDDAVGELVGSLRAAGMFETSLILTTTDNGGMTRWAVSDAARNPRWPASAGDNYPLRGSKATLFEGGVRALGFVVGGLVPPSARGSTFDGLMHAVDLFATMLGRGGVTPSAVDGIDHWDAMTSVAAARDAGTRWSTLRDHVPVNVIHNGTDFSCVVFANGGLKLIVGRPNTVPRAEINGWFRHGLYPPVEGPPASEPSLMLFNLSADPTERHPLPVDTYAALVSEGRALLAKYVVGPDHLGYREPQANTPHIPRCLPVFHGGAWAPFLRNEEADPEEEEQDDVLSSSEEYPGAQELEALRSLWDGWFE